MSIRRVYIDAYNVLRKQPRLARLLRSQADAARRELVTMISSALAGSSDVFVVFDGHGEPVGAGRSVRVVFTRGLSADSWIRRRLEADQRARVSLIVSSDHEVQRHARAMGATVQSAEEFLAGLHTRKRQHLDLDEKNRTLSDGEIREWLDVFTDPDR